MATNERDVFAALRVGGGEQPPAPQEGPRDVFAPLRVPGSNGTPAIQGAYLITADIIKFRHKITPYEGTTVKGVVKRTYVRGSVVYNDGQLVGEPKGKALLKNQL